jgi:hypothetical protein
MVATQTTCLYHPARPGVGICVKCGTVVCTECSTKFDGINHCAVCVAELRRDADGGHIAGPSRALWWFGVVASFLVIVCVGYAIFHMMLLW